MIWDQRFNGKSAEDWCYGLHQEI